MGTPTFHELVEDLASGDFQGKLVNFFRQSGVMEARGLQFCQMVAELSIKKEEKNRGVKRTQGFGEMVNSFIDGCKS